MQYYGMVCLQPAVELHRSDEGRFCTFLFGLFFILPQNTFILKEAVLQIIPFWHHKMADFWYLFQASEHQISSQCPSKHVMYMDALEKESSFYQLAFV